MKNTEELLQSAVLILEAYLSRNPISRAEVPTLIRRTIAALAAADGTELEVASEPQKPAVAVKRSITPEHIVCLEEGRCLKALKRHLRTEHNLTPVEYRSKWGLPHDYPMAAPSYSKKRSDLARSAGLGTKPREPRSATEASD